MAKYIATIRPTETTEIEAEGETLAIARVELEKKLPEGFRSSPFARRKTNLVGMDDVGVPRCPQCLVTLQVAGNVEHPYWLCPVCRTARS